MIKMQYTILWLFLLSCLAFAVIPDKTVLVSQTVTFSATVSDMDCHFVTGQCPRLVVDNVYTVVWNATAGSFPNGNQGTSVAWIAPDSPGFVIVTAIASNAGSQQAIDASDYDEIWVEVIDGGGGGGGGGGIQRIIAVINGQDGIIGPRTLTWALYDEPWWHGSQGSENIVGEFEEDSDWCLEPLGFPCVARNWIIAQANTYPSASVIIVAHSNGADGARKLAEQLTDFNISVDLLYLFDLVPKPWRWEDPDTQPPLPVTNANTAICLYQRDDERRLGGLVYMQGWRVSPGTNTQWHTLNPNPQPSTIPMRYTIEGVEYWINCYPHTEMIFNETNKANLRQAIDNM